MKPTNIQLSNRWGTLFPAMAEHEFALLKKSIKEDGFDPNFPILIRMNSESRESEIVDGSNRFRACQELGVEPMVRDITDELPDTASTLDFVMKRNSARRSITKGQAVAVRVMMAEIEGVNLNLEWQKDVARSIGCSVPFVAAQIRLRRSAPQIADDVSRGEVPSEHATREKDTASEGVTNGSTSIEIGVIKLPRAVRHFQTVTRLSGKTSKSIAIQAIDILGPVAAEAHRLGFSIRGRGRDAEVYRIALEGALEALRAKAKEITTD